MGDLLNENQSRLKPLLQVQRLDVEVVGNRIGGFPALEDGRNDEIRSANHVATCEDLRIRRLERVIAVGCDAHLAAR